MADLFRSEIADSWLETEEGINYLDFSLSRYVLQVRRLYPNLPRFTNDHFDPLDTIGVEVPTRGSGLPHCPEVEGDA